MAAQLIAYFFGLAATAFCATTTFWNQWAITGPSSQDFVDPVTVWRGIWEKCVQNTDEQYTCYMEVSIFETSIDLMVLRCFMCISMIFSFLACHLTLLGLECSQILEDQLNTKRKVMFACGFLHAISCVLTLASASWYTSMVVREYFAFESQDNAFRYELGGTTYMGFGSSLLSLLASLSCFCMPGAKEEENNYTPTTYKPMNSFTAKPVAEYV